MKTNTLKLFLSVVFIAMVGLLFGCNTTVTEPSYVSKIEVVESSIPVGQEVDYFANSNYGMIEILVTYNDGTTDIIPLTAGIITEQVAKYFNYAGTHTITVYYQGKVTNFEIRIFPNGSEHYTYTYVYANRDSYQEAYLAGELANQPQFVEEIDEKEIGWFIDPEFNTEYAFDTPVASDLTLYQKVDERYNKVSYIEENDEVANVMDVLCGTEVTLYTPRLEGYTFTGWEYNGKVVETLEMPQEDITLKATWQINSYEVSYETGTDEVIEPSVLEYNSQVSEPIAVLEKEGYTFEGWTLNGELVDFGSFVMPAKNITLKAKWSINSYKVSFISETVEAHELEYNTEITYPTVEKVGHTFAYWAVDGKETTLTNVPAYDVEFVAVFTPNEYQLTFKSEGMDDVVKSLAYGTTVVLNELVPAPVLEGKNFLYWTLAGNPVYTYEMTTEEVEFVAVYGLNEYTLTIVNNSSVSIETLKYQDSVVLPEPEEKVGYTFSHWSSSVGEEVPTTMPASNVEIVAVYEANKYTLTYDVDGVSVEFEYATDAKIEAIADPEKVGYTFVGWTINDEFVQLEIMPAYDVTLVAKFTINSYVLEYIVDGEVYSHEVYEYNAEVVLPENLEKEGYDFIGWTLDGEVVEISNMPAKDITLVAQFEIEKFDLTYRFADFEYTTRHEYGEEVELLNLALQGYTLIGWTLDGEFIDSGVIVMPANDVTLIAEFVVNTYTLTYVIDGIAINKYVDYKADLDLPEVPVKTGYTFVGWSLDGEIIDFTTMPAKDIMVFAEYVINVYTVSFDILGEITSYEIEYNEVIEFPEVAEKVGHTFVGWSYEGVLKPEEIKEVRMPDFDVKFVAEYTPNEYKVVLNNDGVKSEEVHIYGTEIKLPELSKTGYTFKGWQYGDELISNGTFVIPASDSTLVAVYEINTYVLTLEILDTITSFEYKYDEEVTLPSAPAKEGYTYAGWSLEGEFLGDVTTFNMPATDLTLTIEYTINSYELTLVFGELVNTAIYEYNSEVTLPRLSKVGHTFIGWSDGETITTDTKYVIPAHDTTLTSVFEINSYTLTTIIGDVEDTVDVVYATELPLPAVPPKEGYEFVGWQTEGGEAAPEVMPAADLVLIAVYAIETFEVTYLDGSDSKVEKYEYNTEIELPVLEKEGYTFNGWTLDGVLIKTATINVPAKDITLVADYSVNSYDLVTIIDDVETITKVNYGENLPLPVIPDKEGHTVDGWYNGDVKNTIETMPAETVTLTAKYIVNVYNITFDVLGELSTVEVTYGTEIPYIELPVITDYTFTGWLEGEVEFNETLMPARDVVIVAQYNRITYTVTYLVEGEAVIEEIYYYQDIVKVSDLVPTKFGHTFAGWAIDGDILGETFEMGRASVEINAVFAEFDYSYLTYEVSNNEVIITGINKDIEDGQVYVPSVITIGEVEYPVTTIKAQAFAYNTDITKVLINSNVESIEIYAFRACMNLVSIEFGPDSKLETIGQYAFANCSSLTSIELPEGLQSIGAYAFLGCTKLNNIVIPSTVTSMGNNVFDGCSSLVITVYSSADQALWAESWSEGANKVQYK